MRIIQGVVIISLSIVSVAFAFQNIPFPAIYCLLMVNFIMTMVVIDKIS